MYGENPEKETLNDGSKMNHIRWLTKQIVMHTVLFGYFYEMNAFIPGEK